MYTHSLGGTTALVTNTPILFNSTKYPGVCKPSDTATLEVFKELQRQLNRVAQVKGYTKIAVDGDIGPGVISLMSKVLGTSSSLTCSAAAVGAAVFAVNAKMLADTAGAPATVSGPTPAKASTIVNAAGLELPAPSPSIGAGIVDAFANMSTVAKIAAVGILGGIGYFVLGKKKRKGRR